MTILKSLVTTGGPTLAHKVVAASITDEGLVRCQVHHFSTHADAKSNVNPLWQSYPEIPPSGIFNDVVPAFRAVEQALTKYITSLLLDGEYVDDDAPLELGALKAVTWGAIKHKRDTVEAGGYTHTEMGKVDTGVLSMTRLTAKVVSGEHAAWTKADNTTEELNPTQLRDLLRDITEWVEGLHAHARELREQINAATTPEEVAAVVWVGEE